MLLEKIIEQYNSTCSIFSPKNGALTFAKNLNSLSCLDNNDLELGVMIPNDIDDDLLKDYSNISFYKFNNKELFYLFAKAHNTINKEKVPAENIIGNNCNIHESVIIGIPGQNIAKNPYGKDRIFLKHMGNVIIEDGVVIDALTTVHRSVMDSTIIKKNAVISTHVNIAHNCIVGEDTFIGPGVKIAGSAIVGNNCWIWQGSMIKNGIVIGDNVTVGMGSVVTKSINEPGVYFGNPCKKS